MDITERLENPENIDDPELRDLMEQAELYAVESYSVENPEKSDYFEELAESKLEQYEWCKGLEKGL